ncbi:hypothetical protein [Microbulbifer sp. THAF38]|uniref:hypothetical protein n=1 Tax=unclassified Microbulbifer TaxID=2619833 RepID=UPI001267C1FC|nr:hypothetical protein [Microbulbifer sp. THAF38]QFT53520.1 hypothetical protein FIU95_02905 [Microbulbifer sp. THAF38]
MTATVFVHPTAMSKNHIDQLKRRIDIANTDHKANIRLVQPKPTFARPTQNNNWPPFGGDAA